MALFYHVDRKKRINGQMVGLSLPCGFERTKPPLKIEDKRFNLDDTIFDDEFLNFFPSITNTHFQTHRCLNELNLLQYMWPETCPSGSLEEPQGSIPKQNSAKPTRRSRPGKAGSQRIKTAG
jgi:hypothetical protein